MAARRKQLHHAAAALALLLGGCSLPFGDLPTPVGLPAGTPERPAEPAAYPEVHGAQPTRAERVLSEEEHAKLEQDLAAARQRQPGANAGMGQAASSQPAR